MTCGSTPGLAPDQKSKRQREEKEVHAYVRVGRVTATERELDLGRDSKQNKKERTKFQGKS